MLADAVESTSRALADPTPGSLRKLVHDLLMKRLLDGQFEESGLTLTELHLIEESLCKRLIALFHSRIKYPEAPGKACGVKHCVPITPPDRSRLISPDAAEVPGD